MAGTLYRAPAPGEPPFVKEGDKVTKGQTICIIEAMKLMNEIEVRCTLMACYHFQLLGNRMHCPSPWCMLMGVACLPTGWCLAGWTASLAVHGVRCCMPAVAVSSHAAHACRADATGTIVKFLTENGAPVTPGQVRRS